MTSERDETLMAQVARDQPELLERLVRRHASPLLTFIERMIGDRHRSEELFQDVFLSVWTKRHQYEFPRPFKPWLYAIAINKCRAAYRSCRTKMVALNDNDIFDADASPPDSVIADETAELVSLAVTRLPHQQRAVIVLRIWQGLSYAQIARVVGCTEATARSHMHHGLIALRTHLEPRLGIIRERD